MNPSRPHLFGLLAGLFLAAGLAFASLTLASAWTRIAENHTINVTGSARKNIRSDLAIWQASFSVEAPTLLDAQKRLQDDHGKVTAWLTVNGLEDVSAAPVQIQELTTRHKREGEDGYDIERVGFRLTEFLTIRSQDVDRLPQLASKSSALLLQDIAFESGGFSFIYTKAGEAKVEMMAEATRDARTRAEQIAASGGTNVKELRSAKMGVVQINPLYSSATSWEGNNDTTAIDKTITATVSATFALR